MNRKRVYKLLKIIGILPFISALIFSIIFSLFGGIGFPTQHIGFVEGFFIELLVVSVIIWPFYIIGFVFIKIANKKLKNQISSNDKEM